MVNVIAGARIAAREERGQTMSEYVIVLGIITLGILAAMGALSTAIGVGIDEVVALIPGT